MFMVMFVYPYCIEYLYLFRSRLIGSRRPGAASLPQWQHPNNALALALGCHVLLVHAFGSGQSYEENTSENEAGA